MQQKIEKKFFLSEISASELVMLNYPYKERDNFQR